LARPFVFRKALQEKIVPYGAWQLNFPFANDNPEIIGAAYDPSTQRLYISEDGGDTPGCCGHLPIIHAYHLNTVQDATPPAAPTGLRVM